TLSGVMAGMVANSACCDLVAHSHLALSLVIGSASGLLAYLSNVLLQRIVHIDDPAEAVAVHAGGGVAGLLSAGIIQGHVFPQILDIGILLGFGLLLPT